MKAFLKNYRQTPRKTRLVTGLVNGMKVSDAEKVLTFTRKTAAKNIKNLLKSAVANAKVAGKKEKNLYIKSICVDEGIKLRRFRPRHRGVSLPYKKRTSRIKLELEEKVNK